MTMRTMVLGCGFAAAAIAGASACAGTPADTIFVSGFDASAWVQGYYVGYERDLYPIGTVDFGALTHLMVGRVRPLPDGSVTTDFDIDPVNGPVWARSAVTAAHAAGRKAVLMVGGAGEIEGWRAAAAPAQRATFVANLLTTVEAFQFDGLDLDWEPLEGGDQTDFAALASELRADRPNMLMTVPVGWINSNFQTSDPWYGTIAPLFDRINVMTYDMAGPWDGWQSWHNSALNGASPTTPSSVATSVAFFLASGVPAETLGVGSAFYGYCWQGVTGPLQDGGTFANEATLSYADIINGYYSPSLRQWDATASVPYLSSAAPIGAAGCNFVSYEDEQSIAAKGAYARSHHLGGVIIWTIGEGHLGDRPPGQQDPLLGAIRAAFLE